MTLAIRLISPHRNRSLLHGRPAPDLRARLAQASTVFVLLVAVGCGSAEHQRLLPLPQDVAMGFAVSNFPDHGAYTAELERLKSRYPNGFDYRSDRTSYDGEYPLYWITVGDTSKPTIFFVAVLHAKNEKSGTQMILRFAEKLLDPEDDQREFNQAFLSHFSLVAVPMANPWGYFASTDGKHYNAHAAEVPGIEAADWHDMREYAHYNGVNLNRNFDWNWEAYPNLPWSVRSYWNGQDYGYANYFMAPYYRDAGGNEVYSPKGEYPDRILRPDPEVYDYKGESPFSEPETQLIRDLVTRRYRVVGFADWHTMNPWQTQNASLTSGGDPSQAVAQQLIDEGLRRVNARNGRSAAPIPDCRHLVMEKYDNNAPYAANWAHNAAGVRSFAWETGTQLPDEVWTDAYLEMFYRSIYWMADGPLMTEAGVGIR